MTVELWMLAASIALGVIHLIASSHLISWQRGYRWTAGSREEAVPPLHGATSRVDQATTNFLETFPLQRTYHLGRASLFLGARSIFDRRRNRLRSCAFACMLEHSLRWYCVSICRAVLKEGPC
jgi:hypothetical protein